jgi:hypothetical protein
MQFRELYRGRSQEALRFSEQASRVFPRPVFFSSMARVLAAAILTEKRD